MIGPRTVNLAPAVEEGAYRDEKSALFTVLAKAIRSRCWITRFRALIADSDGQIMSRMRRVGFEEARL